MLYTTGGDRDNRRIGALIVFPQLHPRSTATDMYVYAYRCRSLAVNPLQGVPTTGSPRAVVTRYKASGPHTAP